MYIHLYLARVLYWLVRYGHRAARAAEPHAQVEGERELEGQLEVALAAEAASWVAVDGP